APGGRTILPAQPGRSILARPCQVRRSSRINALTLAAFRAALESQRKGYNPMASPEDRPSNLGPASETAAAPDRDSSPAHTNTPSGMGVGRITGAIWLIALAVGLLAGVASFGVGEYAPELFKPSTEFTAAERANRNQIPALIGARYRQRDD